MIAEATLTLFRPHNKSIVAEVLAGEQYFAPKDVQIYEGSMEDFQSKHPDYEYLENNI